MLQSVEASGNEGERNDEELIKTLTRLHKSEAEAAGRKPGEAEAGGRKTGEAEGAGGKGGEAGPGGRKPGKAGPAQEPEAAKHAEPGPKAPGTPKIEAEKVETGEVHKDSGSNARGEIHEAPSGETAEVAQAQEGNRGSVAESSIRVDVGLLDKLMNLVGELVLARKQILQFANTTEDVGLTAPSQRLNLITTELQEGVMKTRMRPIGNIWSKFPRIVRDVAIACGKQIRI